MELAKLPTDNFYIFISLSGLILIIFSINNLIKKVSGINSAINALKMDLINSEGNIKLLGIQLDSSIKKLILFKKHFTVKYGIQHKYFQYLKDEEIIIPDEIIKNNKTEEFINDTLEIEKLLLVEHKEIGESETALKLLHLKQEIIKSKFSELKLIIKVSSVGIVFGILICIFGFGCWYFKYQIYQDRTTKINYETKLRQTKNEPTSKELDTIRH